MSISSSVQWLGCLDQGHRPNDLFADAWKRHEQEVKAVYLRSIAQITQRIETAEKQLLQLAQRVAKVDPSITPQIVALQTQIGSLRATQQLQHSSLAKAEAAFLAEQKRQHDLTEQLTHLREQGLVQHTVRNPCEKKLLQAGDRACISLSQQVLQ